MKTFCVTVARCGSVFVKAQSEEEAMDIVDDMLTDEIDWSDDWCISDCEEYD